MPDKSKDAPPRCATTIYAGFYSGRKGCSRRGVVERDGKLYCRQHDPEAMKERDRIQREKWDRERAIQRARSAVSDARGALADAVEYATSDIASLPIPVQTALAQLQVARKRLAKLEAGEAGKGAE